MTMVSMLLWTLRKHAHQVAMQDARGTATYAELDDRTSVMASWMIEHGVCKGDRVGVLIDNQREYLETEIAIAKAGAVRVPMLIRSSVDEVTKYLEDAECAVLFAAGPGLGTAREAIARSGQKTTLVAVPSVTDDKAADVPALDGEIDYIEVWTRSGPYLPMPDVTDDDDYALRFTGGTSGRPKGVLMSQRTMTNVVNNVLLNLPVEDDEVVCHVHPVSHASGKIMYTWLMRGARQIFVPSFNFDPTAVFEIVEQSRVTTMFLVPSAINRLLDSGLAAERDCSSLRWLIYGGAPISATRVAEAVAAFGPVLVQIYGSSEAPNILTFLSRDDHVFEGDAPRHLRSAGRIGYNVELRVVDTAGVPCPVGQAGEIVSRGPHVMKEYWRDPELTAARLVDGWMHTGDIGQWGEDGYLYIVDRKDDVIISGGFNVWPAEVEHVIGELPGVSEAAVFGVPDPQWGDAVTAVVVPRPGATLSEQVVKDHLRASLPGHKRPKRVFIRDQPLVKSSAGKILRRAVRDEYTWTESVTS